VKIVSPLSVFFAALMLGGLVAPILGFLLAALIVDLMKRAFPEREPQPVRVRTRPF
jgi:phosphate/sulfate permease